MVLSMYARLRMTCHGYGRMDMVTQDMQPRFIDSSSPTLQTLILTLTEDVLHGEDLFGVLFHWRTIE